MSPPPGSLPTGFGNGFAAGSTAISLRGLGATSTLVLLNGRRMAPFARADDGQKSFTDLSTIPMQIVERIEILKDGDSSTYGADAIAGGVNIILRKDVHGLQLKADTGFSRYSDAKQNKAAVTWGKGNLDEDKFNFVVNAEYFQSDSLKNSDRKDRGYIGKADLRGDGYATNTQFAGGYITGPNDANASPAGSIRNPLLPNNYTSLPGCSTLSATTDQTGANGGCLWHHDQFRDMQPSIESINLYTRGGTYTEGFRAPGAAESNALSQSTGSAPVRDPVRYPGGVPAPGTSATSADCEQLTIATVKVGDPNLKPEESKGKTLGLVWDPLDGTSLSLDAWTIKRSNEINALPYAQAAALPTAVRNDNNLVGTNGVAIPNTGTLVLTQAPYRNSSYTEVSGVDLDVKQRLRLGQYGRAVIGLNWTHVASWVRSESAAVRYQHAGTHGNCDTSNCAGTPKNKINLNASWDLGDLNVTGNVNYRSKMDNTAYAGATCATKFVNGNVRPNAQCEIASLTTLDLSTRYAISKQLTLFASMNNVFDKMAPLDPYTYGGMSYNPMDASGAIGRYMKLGASYKFF